MMGWEAPKRGEYLAVLSAMAEPGHSLWLREGRASTRASSVFMAAASRAGYSIAAGVRMMERFDPTVEEMVMTTEVPMRDVWRERRVAGSHEPVARRWPAARTGGGFGG